TEPRSSPSGRSPLWSLIFKPESAPECAPKLFQRVQIGNDVVDVLGIGKTLETHPNVGNDLLRRMDVTLQHVGRPCDAGIPHRRRIAEAGNNTRVAPYDAEQIGTDPGVGVVARRVLARRMADAAGVVENIGTTRGVAIGEGGTDAAAAKGGQDDDEAKTQ